MSSKGLHPGLSQRWNSPGRAWPEEEQKKGTLHSLMTIPLTWRIAERKFRPANVFSFSSNAILGIKHCVCALANIVSGQTKNARNVLVASIGFR